MCGKRLKSWKSIPARSRIWRICSWCSRLRRVERIGLDPERRRPRPMPTVGSSRKLMQRSSVVLPLPERPMIMTASRCRTSRSTPRSTWLSPKYLSRPSAGRSARRGAWARGLVAARAEPASPRSGRRSHHRSPRAMRRSSRSWKNEKTIVSTQYTSAAMRSASSVCSRAADRRLGPPQQLLDADAATPATLSLIIAMNSLPIAGMTIRMACGRTIRRMIVPLGHAQRLGGLALAARHGLDAGAEDLGHVRAVVEAEGDDPGRRWAGRTMPETAAGRRRRSRSGRAAACRGRATRTATRSRR